MLRSLIHEQDNFVANLLNEKLGLSKQLAQRDADAGDLNSHHHDEQFRQIVELKEQLEAQLGSVQVELNDSKNAQQKYKDEVRSLQEVIRLSHERPPHSDSRSGAKPAPRPPAAGGKGGGGPPYILVLIDGSSACFADGLVSQGKSGGLQAASQVRWEVEKDLRAVDVELDDDDSDDPSEVVSFVYYNKTALVGHLIKNRVISSGTTWESFASAFNSAPASNMIDIGNEPVDHKVATLLQVLGPARTLKRIYIVGISPLGLFKKFPSLRSATSGVSKRIGDKMVIVNHRESDSDRTELMQYGWRVAVFARFFSWTSGLGADWGWTYDDNGESTSHEYTNGYDYGSETSSGGDYPVVGSKQSSTTTGRNVGGGGGGAAGGSAGKWNSASSNKKGKSGPGGRGGRKIDPNRGFLNQDPQICVWYFLSPNGCASRNCARGHDYEFSDAQLRRLQEDVAKTPCKAMRNNGICHWFAETGTKCMYDHSFARRKK